MNYLKEMNAFYIKQETNPLSAAAISLWYAMMHINNRTRWQKEFSVAEVVLCLKASLPSSTFKRARLELRDKGYIVYTPRGNQAPMYEMISLRYENDTVTYTCEQAAEDPKMKQENIEAIKHHNQLVDAVDRKAEEYTVEQMLEIMREQDVVMEQNEAKEEQKEEMKQLTHDTYCFYVEHFGEPKKYVKDELYRWGRMMGDVLVRGAIVRAVESGHLSLSYVQGILKKWQQKQLFTMEDVTASEDRFRKKRNFRYGSGDHDNASFRVQRKEIIPDWFEKRKSYAGLER